jgi:hypothetical protein
MHVQEIVGAGIIEQGVYLEVRALHVTKLFDVS